MKTLRISEIFSSIQGESHHAGYPCTFVRLTGCNLACSYCDTLYAKTGGIEMTVDAVVKKIIDQGFALVEVTGGEPLCQEGTPELLGKLLASGKRVLLETNGSLDLGSVPQGVGIVMDIKTPGSGMEGANNWENIGKLRAGDEIKVVVCGRGDYDWAVKELKAHGVFGRVPVSLSPCAGLVSAAELAAWMVEDRLDARFQLQLHRIIWPGIEKGV